jgi:mRNA interferase RelE/StbE
VTYQVEWAKRALKDFDRLDPPIRQRIAAALDRLATSHQGDVRRLEGIPEEIYRLRVGDWRILFCYQDDLTLLVLRVRSRGSAYEP